MVEKIIPQVNFNYLTKRAKTIKQRDQKIILRHTRKCRELNQAENSKKVISKKIKDRERGIYEQEFEKQRLK